MAPKLMAAWTAVAATMLLAAVVYKTSGSTTALIGGPHNSIYAETGMAVPPPAKPMAHHPHHPGFHAKATTAAEYEHKLGKDSKGHPLPKQARAAHGKSIWERMEDAYFHPAAGIKLTDKVRAAVYAHEGAEPAFKNKKGYKHWAKWENGYFQPLGKGAKVSEKDRLAKYGLEGGSLKQMKKPTFRAKKAVNWQKWEDAEFGHSQSQVAAARLPMEPHKTKKARKFRLGGDTERWNQKPTNKDLIDAIVSKSWVTSAEVDGSKAPAQPIRFIDTIA